MSSLTSTEKKLFAMAKETINTLFDLTDPVHSRARRASGLDVTCSGLSQFKATSKYLLFKGVNKLVMDISSDAENLNDSC